MIGHDTRLAKDSRKTCPTDKTLEVSRGWKFSEKRGGERMKYVTDATPAVIFPLGISVLLVCLSVNCFSFT